jgi:hypothetical protein
MHSRGVFDALFGDRLLLSLGWLATTLLAVTVLADVLTVPGPPVRTMGVYLAIGTPLSALFAFRNRGLLVVYVSLSWFLAAGSHELTPLGAIAAPLSPTYWTGVVGAAVLSYALGRSGRHGTTGSTPSGLVDRAVTPSNWRVVRWCAGIGVALAAVRLVLPGVLAAAVGLVPGSLLFVVVVLLAVLSHYAGGGALGTAGFMLWAFTFTSEAARTTVELLWRWWTAVGSIGFLAAVGVLGGVTLRRVVTVVPGRSFDDWTSRRTGSAFLAGLAPWLVVGAFALAGAPSPAAGWVAVGYASMTVVVVASTVGLAVLPFYRWHRLDSFTRYVYGGGFAVGLSAFALLA